MYNKNINNNNDFFIKPQKKFYQKVNFYKVNFTKRS